MPDLEMARGTDAVFTLSLKDAEEKPLNLSGGSVRFVAKKLVTDSTAFLDKSCTVTDAGNGIATLTLVPSDTSTLQYDTALVCDVIYTDGSNKKQVVIEGLWLQVNATAA